MGYISWQEGYFPTKKTETIDLETVVSYLERGGADAAITVRK